jgi:hypothetical protein
VQAEDSFEHIAVMFNMTPAELRRINKLHSGMIFPGQVLLMGSALPYSQTLFVRSQGSSQGDALPPASRDAASCPVTPSQPRSSNSIESVEGSRPRGNSLLVSLDSPAATTDSHPSSSVAIPRMAAHASASMPIPTAARMSPQHLASSVGKTPFEPPESDGY